MRKRRIGRPQKPGKGTTQRRPCATVFLPYSKLLPIYGIVRKWKENRKLFTFLNDAIDLRKHGIKNEIQFFIIIAFIDKYDRRSKLKNKIWHSGHYRHIALLERIHKQVKISRTRETGHMKGDSLHNTSHKHQAGFIQLILSLKTVVVHNSVTSLIMATNLQKGGLVHRVPCAKSREKLQEFYRSVCVLFCKYKFCNVI